MIPRTPGVQSIANQTLRDIYLHGSLGEKYGHHQRLAVETSQEALRALMVVHKDFRRDIHAGQWVLCRGETDKGLALEGETLGLRLGKQPLHILPAPVGSGHGGGKIIMGVALIAAAFVFAPAVGALGAAEGTGAATAVTDAGAIGGGAGVFGADLGASTGILGITYGQIAGIGAALVLSGIASLIAPNPKNVNAQSYALSGAQNTATEGAVVPVVYGRVLTGSVVGGFSIITADYDPNGPPGQFGTGSLQNGDFFGKV